MAPFAGQASSSNFGQQTRALVLKSWMNQKRQMGSNICLCVAPIFFCVILAIIQVLVNALFLSGVDFECGCRCTQCCPNWALTSGPGYTTDGNGNVTISNINAFPSAYLLTVSPSQVTLDANNVVTAIRACAPLDTGACLTELDYTCKSKDSSTCGIQYSNPAQAIWCSVPRPSAWPASVQVPDVDSRASPWGSTVETVGGASVTVAQPASLITADTVSLSTSMAAKLFPGQISTSAAVLSQALLGLYAGNASDPNQGNIVNADMLSLLGLQFGTNADSPLNLVIGSGFTRGTADNRLFAMLPNATCVERGIATSSTVCLAELLRLYWTNAPNANATNVAALVTLLPACGSALARNPNQLLSATSVMVQCTEAAVVPQPNAAALEALLYCGYFQARCDLASAGSFNQYMVGYDMHDTSNTRLNMDMYWNQTRVRTGGQGPPAGIERLPAGLTNAVLAWWTDAIGGTGSAIDAIKLLGVMGMPKPSSKLSLDFSSLLGPLFFTWVVQLLLPTFLQQLVYEKEKRLRMMMKMHGLGDAVYWLVTYLWFLILYCIYIIIFIAVGAAAQLYVFRKTNLGIQVIFYFLHGNCMIAFAFMLSSLFTSSRTAVVVAFLYVFASGLIGQLLLIPFMDDDKSWLFFVEWIPAWSLFRGLYEMSAYTQLAVVRNQSGMQFDDLSTSGNGMQVTWAIFLVEWALFLVAGLYLEQVVASGTGARRHPLFFINWMWKKPAVSLVDYERTSVPTAQQSNIEIRTDGVSDVEAEKARVDALGSDVSDYPIIVKDIKKVYPALDGGQPKVAVRTMTLGIQRGECFGLLGPNGAGKTTCIGMLTGFLEPTAGTGIVEGLDISTDMPSIYKIMGVCPQHDLLWEQLSAREHLQFYGRLKGMNGKELDEMCDAGLKSVNLFNAGVGDKLSGKYSGGMKRRLSVAISFMGSPKVVYLDECSTGLDPASRRTLWDVIKASKAGRSIILTTHSMEEAEVLCDRLGIFVDGQLVCIGNPKEITSRYAGYLVFSISVPPEQEAAARALVLSMSPSATLTYALGGTLKYELPTTEVTLSKVFEAINASKDQLTIVDWGVANATLEEVFIKLAKSAGATSKD